MNEELNKLTETLGDKLRSTESMTDDLRKIAISTSKIAIDNFADELLRKAMAISICIAEFANEMERTK